MKIGFITTEYPHPKIGASGGIGTSIFNLAQALIALGNEVYLFIYGQNTDEFFVEDNIHFYRIKNIKIRGLSFFLTQNKLQGLINSLCKLGEIDIVEAPDWTGFTAFLKLNCPLIIREHGSDTYFCYLDKRPVKFKNKFLERRALKKADGIISVSHFTGSLTDKLMRLNKDFTVIPNGVNIEFFNPCLAESKQLRIFYFGSLIRKKGLLELAQIFNLVYEINNEVKLILVGEDCGDVETGSVSTWELMKPIFSPFALKNISYLGGVPYHSIQEYIKEATVCVFPSFAEAFPVSWLEAMAMEKGIVASNIGWANEMIEDGTDGYLVNPTDHKLCANRILELLTNKKLRMKFGKSARKKVESQFSHDLVANKTLDFYKLFVKK